MNNFNPDTIADYFDLAKMRSKIKSDEALAAELGISKSAISQMRGGEYCPNDEVMVHLAHLAFPSAADPRNVAMMALAQLNSWRIKAKDSPFNAEVRRAYDEMVARFKKFAAAILLAFGIAAIGTPIAGTSPAQAATKAGPVYIMENYICFLSMGLARFAKEDANAA